MKAGRNDHVTLRRDSFPATAIPVEESGERSG